MVASPKKFAVDIELNHNIINRGRFMTSAFSGALVGEIRYDTVNEMPSWWTFAGAEKKISDITLNTFASPTASVSFNSQKLTNLGTPTLASDATTKAYVDAVAQGLSVKSSCFALSITNIATLSGVATVDGVSLVATNRVLLNGQTTASQNGIWVVSATAWTRPSDFFTGTDAASTFTFIQKGTLYADSGWTCTSDTGSAVVDTNNLSFTQFSGAGQILAGTGLTKTGNSIDAIGGLGIQANADDLQIKLDATLGANLYNTFSLTTNGLALKLDNSTIGSNGSSQIYVPSGGITSTQINATAISSGLTGGSGTVITVKPDVTGGANLAQAINVSTNGVAVKIDSVTITANVSNQLQVANNSITPAKLTTTVAGNGLTGGNGTALSVVTGSGLTIISNAVQIDTTLVPRKFAVTIGDGTTTDLIVTHNLGTKDVIVQIWETSGSFEEVYADTELTSTTTLTAKFAIAPTAGQYRIVVLG